MKLDLEEIGELQVEPPQVYLGQVLSATFGEVRFRRIEHDGAPVDDLGAGGAPGQRPTCASAEAGSAATVTLARTTAAAARTRIVGGWAPGARVKCSALWTRLRIRVFTSVGPFPR